MKKTELAFDSVTRIECYKRGGMILVGSEAYCLRAKAAIPLSMLDIELAYFPVLSWNEDRIIAADSSTASFPNCTWTQITVNLDHSIMATDTRKLCRDTTNSKMKIRPENRRVMLSPQQFLRELCHRFA